MTQHTYHFQELQQLYQTDLEALGLPTYFGTQKGHALGHGIRLPQQLPRRKAD